MKRANANFYNFNKDKSILVQYEYALATAFMGEPMSLEITVFIKREILPNIGRAYERIAKLLEEGKWNVQMSSYTKKDYIYEIE